VHHIPLLFWSVVEGKKKRKLGLDKFLLFLACIFHCVAQACGMVDLFIGDG